MTVQNTLQNTMQSHVDKFKQQAIMVQEDEVLALAEKIKNQRRLDHEYLKAFGKLDHLYDEVFTSGDKSLRDCNSINISFYTIDANHRVEETMVKLPVESGDELINFLLEHSEARNGLATSD